MVRVTITPGTIHDPSAKSVRVSRDCGLRAVRDKSLPYLEMLASVGSTDTTVLEKSQPLPTMPPMITIGLFNVLTWI